MKGLGAKRNRHLSDSCDPTQGPPEPLYPHQASTLPRSPYLLSPTSMDHYGTMDPRNYNPSMDAQNNQGSLPPDYSLPLNNQLSNSSTFPHVHYNSHYDPSDFSPPQEDSIGGISTGTLGTSMSMGMGMGMHGMSGMGGLQSSRGAMITSGSATISGGAKMNRQVQPNLLDQLEKQLPGGPRDGFSTLQLHRSTSAALSVASKQRTDSPGRIRNLVCSVQKLFAKSQSMDGHNIKGVNGRSGTGSGSGGTSSGTEDGGKRDRRAKSKDRGGAKSDGGGTGKRRPRSNMSGYWSSDDLDNADLSNYRNPMAMTLGRPTTHATQHATHSTTYDAQQGALQQQQGQQSRYVVHSGYNTISSSKSSNEVMKYQQTLPGPGGGGGGISMGVNSNDFKKGGSWSTLTLGQPTQVLQKGHSSTLDRSMLKSKSCQQEFACHYLQVGRRGDWSSTLGRSGGGGGANEIPCRRMRSGSYVKAMGDLEDSDDSDGSPKPSPKMAARRQSYLRATQQSLSDQLPPRNCLPSLQELSTNRSLDNLDCLGGPVRGSLFPRWDDEDFNQGGGCSTLGRSSCMGQLRDLEMISQRYEDSCSESAFRESHRLSRSHSQAVEPPDLPMPTCFRSRSHSYLRAIQAGCSQDDDTASMDSDSPPPTATTVRTYSTSTVSTCITTCKKPAPPPVPPRTTSKPYISVTVQSSTESAQDTYLDHQSERDRRSKTITSQSSQAHSNSSDSLDSTRANSLARGVPRPIPVPVATPREPLTTTTTVHHAATGTDTNDSQREPLKTTGINWGNLMAEEPRADIVPRRKLSSIGIQVDCIEEEVQREETPTPPLAKFQSIGIQADDGWEFSHSSSMASKQETDSDTQDLPVISHAKPAPEKKSMVNNACQSMDSPPFDGQVSQGNGSNPTSTSPPPLRQFLNRSTTRSSSDSFAESLDPALDPSFLPPPDPWLESGNGNGNGGSGIPNAVPLPGPACRRDGHWFLKLLQAETGRMEGWCQQMEQETKDNQLSEEVLGKVRSAVGSAQLLMTKKFEQFRGLCEQNLNVNANLRPTAQDLAGFWDLLQLSIEDISLKFDELYHLKSSDWQPPAVAHSPPERKEDQKEPPPPVPKKPVKGRPMLGREKSADSASSTSSAEKHRTEARKRLLAAKRAASVRQNSATESADSIEIYVPEAQTRL
ncbi:disks large-associated protein 4-like isoform X2 [Coregonus clupeaformis]|uniref:disks large-associated protein 4-like isoform X2 n=1 Tax=Coregonus clupeaformis TaxID=59861 RepID=UPI001E1C942A|nr:disks large-associated protein 4-like isoform X2 [Coregonus clupeaformis]